MASFISKAVSSIFGKKGKAPPGGFFNKALSLVEDKATPAAQEDPEAAALERRLSARRVEAGRETRTADVQRSTTTGAATPLVGDEEELSKRRVRRRRLLGA